MSITCFFCNMNIYCAHLHPDWCQWGFIIQPLISCLSIAKCVLQKNFFSFDGHSSGFSEMRPLQLPVFHCAASSAYRSATETALIPLYLWDTISQPNDPSNEVHSESYRFKPSTGFHSLDSILWLQSLKQTFLPTLYLDQPERLVNCLLDTIQQMVARQCV